MSDDVKSNETFHLGEETEENFHLGGGEEEGESFHLGGGEEEGESFHLGGGEEEGESFHLGGETEETFSLGGNSSNGSLHIDGEVFSVAGKSADADSGELDYSISDDGNSVVIDACDEAMDVVQDFVSDKLMAYGCDKKAMMQIRLAVEEIFVNIISYAYRPEIGKAEIFCEVTEDPLSVCVQFMDSGKPFDPLAKKDVDDSEALFMERAGGFGIHLVKRTMDAVDYSYEDGRNVLTIHKKLTTE